MFLWNWYIKGQREDLKTLNFDCFDMRKCHEAKHFSVSFCLSRQKLRNMRRASKNLAPILGERIRRYRRGRRLNCYTDTNLGITESSESAF